MISKPFIWEQSPAIRKSGRVFKAFVHMYLPYYGLKSEFFFDNFEIFALISFSMYEIDEVNEKGGQGVENSLDRLASLLAERDLLSKWGRRIIQDGKQYLEFELKAYEKPYTQDSIIEALGNRSADFRLMHSVALKLAGIPETPEAISFFREFELLFEAEDDLSTFESDKANKTFNTPYLFELGNDTNGLIGFFEWLKIQRFRVQSNFFNDESLDGKEVIPIWKWYRIQVPEKPFSQADLT